MRRPSARGIAALGLLCWLSAGCASVEGEVATLDVGGWSASPSEQALPAPALTRATATSTSNPAPAPTTATDPTSEQAANPVAQPEANVALGSVPAPAQLGDVVVGTARGTVHVYRSPLAAPNPSAAAWTFGLKTQFGSPTTFLTTQSQGDWLQVIVPVRENGTLGWLHKSEVALATHSTHIVVDLGNRRITAYQNNAVVLDSHAVIGKPSTPTPRGTFFVTDVIDTQDPTGPYGPYVLALSGRSDAFDFFNGGEPLVGLHGTNAPGLLGSAASNGCVRLPNDIATLLATIVPLGAAVHIV